MSSAESSAGPHRPPPAAAPRPRPLPQPDRLGLAEVLEPLPGAALDLRPDAHLLRSPTAVRRLAGGLTMLLVLLAVGLLVLPWRQSALGTGRVIAFSPDLREQVVEAPVTGQVVRWGVVEGEQVEEGQLLVVLGDNDPAWMQRLEDQQQQARTILGAAREQVGTYRLKVEAESLARDLSVSGYEARLAGQEQELLAELATLETARLNRERVEALAAEGLESERSRELAALGESRAEAAVAARGRLMESLERARDQAQQVGQSKVRSAEAELQAALAKEAEARKELVSLEATVARQARQEVHAPRAGQVLGIRGGAGGEQISSGDRLLTLVPQTDQRAVELVLDGNDLPLVGEGDEVRLLFEGWPALQFSGWPELSQGTFAGTVASIDATDDGSGAFRILVQPDPASPPWPEARLLRQGVKVKGFVLLGQVSLGYELWRQLNGFPAEPPVQDGQRLLPPTSKKPRAPGALK